jgi:hypothetical protein
MEKDVTARVRGEGEKKRKDNFGKC